MLKQKGEYVVYWFGINNVIVVKDKDEVVGDGSDFIDQGCQNRFDWRWLRLRSVEHTQHSFSKFGCNSFDFALDNRLQSSDEINQKVCRVVIPFVQRQPGNRS